MVLLERRKSGLGQWLAGLAGVYKSQPQSFEDTGRRNGLKRVEVVLGGSRWWWACHLRLARKCRTNWEDLGVGRERWDWAR